MFCNFTADGETCLHPDKRIETVGLKAQSRTTSLDSYTLVLRISDLCLYRLNPGEARSLEQGEAGELVQPLQEGQTGNESLRLFEILRLIANSAVSTSESRHAELRFYSDILTNITSTSQG